MLQESVFAEEFALADGAIGKADRRAERAGDGAGDGAAEGERDAPRDLDLGLEECQLRELGRERGAEPDEVDHREGEAAREADDQGLERAEAGRGSEDEAAEEERWDPRAEGVRGALGDGDDAEERPGNGALDHGGGDAHGARSAAAAEEFGGDGEPGEVEQRGEAAPEREGGSRAEAEDQAADDADAAEDLPAARDPEIEPRELVLERRVERAAEGAGAIGSGWHRREHSVRSGRSGRRDRRRCGSGVNAKAPLR